MLMQTLEVPISEKLRECITQSGLSQSELARETGIPQPSISRFMTGDRGLRLDAIEALCEYFGLVLSEDEKPRRRK